MFRVPTLILWVGQSTVLASLGLLLLVAFRVRHPWLRLRWCQAVLVAALALPWMLPISGAHVGSTGGTVEVWSLGLIVDEADGAPAAAWALSSPWWLLGVWLTGSAGRLAWLVLGAKRLRALRHAAVEVDDPVLDAARVLVGVEATCASSAGVSHPMTWGIRQPLVLVPEGLAALPPKQREAVYVHEFLHVARRDVLAVWLEEAIRTALCLHPAVWIVSSRVRLAREQVVDAETVALTAARRPYLEALLWCADAQTTRTAHALPFFTRHQLLTRVASLTTEVPMSRVRTVLTTGALTAVFAAGSLALASVAPLPSASQAQAPDAEEPGPLERVAVLPTLDVPAPRRTVAVNPFWPAEAVAEGMAARYRMHVVVDAAGAVGEARIITQVAGHAAAVSVTDGRAAQRALRQAALDAVRQWQFELPAVAPMMLVTEVTVGDLMTASSPDAPVQVGGDVRAPRKVHDVPPVYPQVAQDAKVQGVVIMEVVLERTGDVSDVRVLRSIPLLDAAAIDAVRQWKYEPSADRLRLVLTINFALQP